MACFAVWILTSALWSDAPARALTEFDRALLYCLMLVLMGSLAARVGNLSILLRWVAAAFAAIAIAGLLTRLLPQTFPTGAAYLPERLSFPLTYWNAMGIACALGALLVLHLTSSGREGWLVRVVAAALLPPIAVTLYLTFSRGAIWVVPVGIVLYVLLAHPRGLLTAVPAVGIPTAIAVKVAYGADLLARGNYDSSAAAFAQGRHVAWIVAACMLGALLARAATLPLDRRIERVPLPRGGRLIFVGAVLTALLVGAALVDAPRRFGDAIDTFEQDRAMAYTEDLRTRLTSAADNGRIAHWRVALDAFSAEPLHGSGAGTYQILWNQHRPDPPFQVIDGHSLYLETMAELGIVGLVLLVVALGALLVGGVVRTLGPERHAYAAFVAGGTMLAIHAGVDWDWEMPALFIWLFGAGGIALASRRARLGEIGRVPRVVAALGVLVLALTPALFWYSQGPLQRATDAFATRDCDVAIDAALTATERFGTRPEPWAILGYCDARLGQYDLARRAMDAAHTRDPDNWAYSYGQAIVYGVSGLDPRPFAARALRLNPLDETAKTLVAKLADAKSAAARRQVTVEAPLPPG